MKGSKARAVATVACVVLVLYFAVLPLLLLVWSVVGGGKFLETAAAVASRPANLRALAGTIAVSAGSALLALAIGLPLGFVLASTDVPGARTLRDLFALPYTIPSYVVALAWTYLASGKSGWLNRFAVEVIGLSGAPFEIYSAAGVVFVLGLSLTPLVLMGVIEALSRVDASLVEAARSCGASPARAILDVVWPLVKRSALGGALVCFLAAAAAYGVPAVLGPSAHPPVTVLTTRIKAYVDLHTTRGFTQAIALSSLLFLLAAAFPLAGSLSGPAEAGAGTRPSRRFTVALGRWRLPVLAAVLALLSVALILPLGALVLSSLIENVGRGLDPANLSLVHWRTVLGRSDVVQAIVSSLMLASGAATLALAVGGMIAYHESRSASRLARVPAALLTVPYATPGTVLAIGMILAFTGAWGPSLYNTPWVLLVAYTVKEVALAYRLVREGLAQIHPSMEEAARVSGASWGRAMRDVVLPLVSGNLMAAWLLVFMPSFGELTMSILLFGPETPTVGTVLFELASYEDPAAAAVLAVIVVAVVLTATVLVRLGRRGLDSTGEVAI